MKSKKKTKPGPKPRTEADRARRRNISLSDRDWELIVKLADERGVTYSEAIRQLVRDARGKGEG